MPPVSNLNLLWWMNLQRKKHERQAEESERRAAQAVDPRQAEQLRRDARIERIKAKRYDTGIRF